MRRFESESRPVVVTDSLEMVPRLRAAARAPFLKIADAALYCSKNADRNRVTATMLNATGD